MSIALGVITFATDTPNVEAESIATRIDVVVDPKTTGIGFPVYLLGWVTPAPPKGTDYHNMDYTITCPNGTIITGTIATDWSLYPDQGVFYVLFTPSSLGTHSVRFHYPGETIGNNEYSASESLTQNFEVDPSGFWLGGDPGQLSIKKGESATYNLTLSTWGDFSGSVTTTYESGAPEPSNVNLSPSAFPWIVSVLRIDTTSSTPAGVYSILISGTGGGSSNLGRVTLIVIDFSISTSPSKLYIRPGDSASYSVNLTSYLWYPYDGNVSLSTPTLPSGIYITPSPPSVSFSPSSGSSQASSTSNLMVATNDTCPVGLYNLGIIGTAGTLTHQTTVQLAVGKELVVPNSPENLEVEPGEIANFNVTVSEGIPPYTYQWYDSTGIMTGRNSSSLSIKETAGNYTYYCVVTDLGGQTKETNKVTLTVSSSSPPLPWFTIVVASVIGVLILAIVGWSIMRWRKIVRSQSMAPIPVGWQFYEGLTAGDPPGTVYRFNKKSGMQHVETIARPKYQIDIEEFPEDVGKYTQTANMNTLIQFTGLKPRISGKTKRTHVFKLEMPGLMKEKTDDMNLDRLLEQLINKKEFRFRDEEKYYVIRQARKTMEINYQLTDEVMDDLGGESSLNEAKLEGKSLTFVKEQRVINQKFTTYRRVMFNAEQLKLKRDKTGKISIER